MIKRILSIGIILIICLSCLSISAHASNVSSWTEYFNNGLTDWTSYGYATEPLNSVLVGWNATEKVDAGYTVSNGMLKSGYNYDKDDTGLGNISFIFHDSSFKEGNFSFDAFIANWTTTRQWFSVFVMISEQQNNNKYNFLDETSGNIYHDAITLEFVGDFGYHWIELWNDYINRGHYYIPTSQYNSFHHFVVSINTTEGMNVTMDNKNILSTLDTPTFQSDRFGFNNRDGFSMFDNISVEGTPATNTKSTPGFEFVIVLPTMIAVALIFEKNRKKAK